MTDQKKAAGSGVTARSVLRLLQKQSNDAFVAELRGMRGPRGFKPRQIEDMAAGFSDGMSNIIRHFVAMGVLVVVEDSEAAAPAGVRE